MDSSQPIDSGQITAAPPLAPLERPRAVAHWLHTLFLAVVLLALSLGGANSQHTMTAKHGKTILYVVTMSAEWIIVGYIWLGVRRRSSMRELIGERWKSPEQFLLDVGLAIAFWVAASAVLAGLGVALGLAHPGAINDAKQKLGFIAPSTLRDLCWFFAVSATAGFCEEVIFRGYFQRQFAALGRNVWFGLIAQALLFGLGHGYEGGKRMLLITVYGAMFGLLAHFRKNLRPGMMAHFMHDAIAGTVLWVLTK